MKTDKYFALVSIIAFLSLSYITYNDVLSFNYLKNQYAAVITAPYTISTSTTLSTSTIKGLPPESPTNYTDNRNGTITDNYTGLVWVKCSQGNTGSSCNIGSPTLRAWSKARSECDDLVFAGNSNWRMPTLKELQSIVDSGRANPAINKNFFSGSNYPYWASTAPAGYSSSRFTVVFADGVVYYKDMNNYAATRCVHDPVLK